MKKIILAFLFVFILIFPVESFAQTTTWHDNTMNYRHQITINSSQVSGSTNLSNFPILVSIQNGLNLNQNNIQSNGQDIRFYDNSGTALDFEIESFNTNSISGSLTAWVRIPSMTAITDSTIWLYHGNTTATDGQNPIGVWSSDYITVNHLSDLLDSTTNNNDGTNSGSSSITGQVGLGRSFDGTNDRITLNPPNFGSGAFTVSAWVNPTDLSTNNPTYGAGIARSTNGDVIGDYILSISNSGAVRFSNWESSGNDADGTYITASGIVSAGTDYHIVGSYDGAGTSKIYINGESVTFTDTGTASGWGTETSIGRSYTGSDYHWDGKIDEVRFSNVAKFADWITTEYNNQNSPNTFLTIATIENKPVTPTTPTPTTPTTPSTNQNSSNSIDGGLFIMMLILSLLCFVLSVKYGTALLFITIILTLSLGVTLIAGYDVTFTETTTVNNDTFTTTKCLICNNGEWLGWSLFLFGILSLMFFLLQTFRGN